MSVTLADILAARSAIRGVADATPFVPSPFMSARAGRRVPAEARDDAADRRVQATRCHERGRGAGRRRARRRLLLDRQPRPGRGLCRGPARDRGRSSACRASCPKAKVDGIRALGAEVRIVGTLAGRRDGRKPAALRGGGACRDLPLRRPARDRGARDHRARDDGGATGFAHDPRAAVGRGAGGGRRGGRQGDQPECPRDRRHDGARRGDGRLDPRRATRWR